MRDRISIVLCTFNGRTFLQDQLDSLTRQTRLPDELIISDDASTDDSVRLAESFAASAPFPVRIHSRTQNVGFRENFGEAIRMASGDILFLSDQDDVWLESKVERMAAQFEADPALGMAFSDAEVVDSDLRPTGTRLWSSAVQFDGKRRARFADGEGFHVLLGGNVVTGATMAFRSRYTDRLFPLDTEALHDGWIALLISAVAPIVAIEEPLILYRQHTQNQVGTFRMGALRRMARAHQLGRASLAEQSRILQRLAERTSDWSDLPAANRTAIDEMIQHLNARAEYPEMRIARVVPVLREMWAGRYQRCSNGFSSVIRDLLV